MNVNLLTLNQSSIPRRLRDIPSSPKKLYAIGDTSLLSSKYTLSVVGSRKISTYGKYVTNKLVGRMSKL